MQTGTAPQVTVNGEALALTGTDPCTTALDWLRSRGLTGAKEGCAEGECGACAVMVARPDGAGGSHWVAVNACLSPAGALAGQEVTTSEGLGTPEALHPVQSEMAVRGGSQCGYCTPGFICSMAAEYYRPDREPRWPTARSCSAPGAASHEAPGPNGFDLVSISGNLCRCTGYRPIRPTAASRARVPRRPTGPGSPAGVRAGAPERSRPGSGEGLRPAPTSAPPTSPGGGAAPGRAAPRRRSSFVAGGFDLRLVASTSTSTAPVAGFVVGIDGLSRSCGPWSAHARRTSSSAPARSPSPSSSADLRGSVPLLVVGSSRSSPPS